MTPDVVVLQDYERWLGATALRLLGRTWTEDDLQDIKQEGRVAMWRALETFDESRGSLPSWLTGAALQRMQDVAWGRGQPFGHEAIRGSREVDVDTSLDSEPEDVVEALLGYVEEAYHDGEVIDAIRALSPAQQQYVFLRFWGGLDPSSRNPAMKPLLAQFPVMSQRHHWQRAKEKLRESLAHREALRGSDRAA